MNYGLYAIKDAKSTFFPVNADLNDSCAIRNFEHAVRQPDSLLRSHPNDYSLFRVGSYNNETGMIESFDTPVLLTDAAAVLKEV